MAFVLLVQQPPANVRFLFVEMLTIKERKKREKNLAVFEAQLLKYLKILASRLSHTAVFLRFAFCLEP